MALLITDYNNSSCFALFSLFALVPSPDELARVVGDRDKMVVTLIKLRNTDEENVIKKADFITKSTDAMKKEVKRSYINKIKEMDKAQFKNCGILLMVISFSHLSGIFAVSAFLLDIFSSTDISSVVLVLVSGFSEMVFSFLQMAVADRLGR